MKALALTPEQSSEEALEFEISWLDASLDAAFFFKCQDVSPLEAAMLLCQINPINETEAAAEECHTDHTNPEDFKRLRRAFKEMESTQKRSLLDWLRVAEASELKTHPWVQKYVARRFGPHTPPKSGLQQQGQAAITAASKKPNRGTKDRNWWSIARSYIVEVMRAGQYGTAKDVFRALESKVGEPDSPFELGTGNNRGSLYIPEIGQTLALKTFQNKFKELRELQKK